MSTHIQSPTTFVLEYRKEVYQEIFKKELITDFDHGPLTKGSIDQKLALTLISNLDQKAQIETKSIRFVSERLEKELAGGSCSAIALRIAFVALSALGEIEKIPSSERHSYLIQKVSEIIETINKEGQGEKKRHKLLRTETRTLQAAFNTITVNTEVKECHFAQEKVAALASYYGLWRLSFNRRDQNRKPC